MRYLIAVVLLSSVGWAQTYVNPVGREIRMGDPFVLQHDGRYYLYGTNAGDGFKAWTSDDLTDWRELGYVYRKASDSWCGKTYWAPEVIAYRERFYMVFSCQPGEAESFSARIVLAVGDRPEGPFKDLHLPLFDAGYSAIDGHIFIDDDGRPYVYFARVGTNPNPGAPPRQLYGEIHGAPLKADLSGLAAEPTLCVLPDSDWEESSNLRSRAVEGAYVFRHGDRYYMTYSGGHYADPKYGIGYATASSPLGAWTKAPENPIVSADASKGVSGPGHSANTFSPDGREMFMVYHAHADAARPSGSRTVNIDRLVIEPDGRLRLVGPTRTEQPLPSGAE